MKRLFLFRHAKAAPDDGGGDHERVLTGRGRRDAPEMGKVLAVRGFRPDLVLCSTAQRTAETWELAAPFFVPLPALRMEPGLYHAVPDAILAHVARAPEEAAAIMVVGHNPGLEELALRLAGKNAMAREIAVKFPTSAFAAFESRANDWPSAVQGSWTALAFLTPGSLSG